MMRSYAPAVIEASQGKLDFLKMNLQAYTELPVENHNHLRIAFFKIRIKMIIFEKMIFSNLDREAKFYADMYSKCLEICGELVELGENYVSSGLTGEQAYLDICSFTKENVDDFKLILTNLQECASK